MIARDVSGGRPGTPASLSPGPVLVALAVASLVELLVLRTFTRTAVHIPALSALQGPYELISTFGRFSYYEAAVLLIVALPVAFTALWRQGDRVARTAAVTVAGFGLAAVAARSQAVDILLVDSLSVGVVVLAASAALGAANRRASLVIGAFAVSFLLQGTSSLLQDAASEGVGSFETRWLLWAAEWLALVFAVAAPFALAARPSRAVLAVSVALGVATLAVLLANGSTTRVLLLWNEGLTGTLPAAGYALAAATLLAATLGLLGQHRVLAAAGLVLLVTGGIGLHSTYQTGLVVAGFAVLCLAARESAAAKPAAAA